MGKCETATASIGINILLSDLVSQINENNFFLIKEMLHEGFIEDNNGFFNEVYEEIIYENKLPDHFLEFKEYLTNKFTNNGSYDKTKDGDVIPTIDRGCLFNKHLLVPVKKILKTERWGYDRYGTNGCSIPIDFDLSANIEKYKEIEKIEVIFILSQTSG